MPNDTVQDFVLVGGTYEPPRDEDEVLKELAALVALALALGFDVAIVTAVPLG